MLIHQYDNQTGQYIASRLADEDPRNPGRWLVPAFATADPLPERLSLTWPFYRNDQWVLLPDWRGRMLYRRTGSDAGTTAEILMAGITPDEGGLTDVPRPSDRHIWSERGWVLDPAAIAAEKHAAGMAEFERRLGIARAKNTGRADAYAAGLLDDEQIYYFKAWSTVKAGKLIVAGRGAGKSASGLPLPSITLTPDMLLDYEITFADRASFAAVRTRVHDTKTGQKIDLVIPNPDAPKGATAVHTERHAFASQEAAKAGADARLQKLNHHTAKSTMLMQGRADFSAEKTVTLKGFKKEADGDFLVDSVTHDYAGRSWETRVELNAGNKGKAKVGHGKKTTKTVNLVVPAPPH